MDGPYLVTSDEALPGVARAPAPWTLHGSAWILVLRLPEAIRRAPAHLVPELRGATWRGPSIVMIVD